MTEKAEDVQKLQNYIEAHLYEQITPCDLAQTVHYSPWYTARIFKELTGLYPADYIRRLRLSKSALRLRDEKVRIIDMAFEMGFDSVDGYQRAFAGNFACNPTGIRKKSHASQLLHLRRKTQRIWKKEKKSMENVKNVFIPGHREPQKGYR